MITKTKWTAVGITFVAFAIAAALTVGDIRLASSQTVTLVAKRSEDAVPADDPFSDVWNRASPVEVPLSAQNLTPPKAGSDRTVKVRALHEGDRLYINVEWEDDTENSSVSRQTDFTDAVAVQFPVTPGEQVPSFCMGNPDAPVNIWQWKGSYQADMEAFVDVQDTYPNMIADDYQFEDEEIFYPARAAGNIVAQTNRVSAADNLLAGSFGTLTQAEAQLVEGTGEWRDGEWRVVVVRDMTVDGEYTQFAEDDSTNVAFAVWDGASGERDGMKSVSQFLTLDVSSEVAEGAGGALPIWAIVLIVAGGLGLAATVGGVYLVRQRREA